jgi:hypothetical protein
MMTTATPSLTDRFASPLEGMRASVAAEGRRRGPAAALAAAILSFFECLLALLREFEAGTLVAHNAPRSGEPAATELRPTRADRSGHREPRVFVPNAGSAAAAGVAAGCRAAPARCAPTRRTPALARRSRIAPAAAFAGANGSIRATGLRGASGRQCVLRDQIQKNRG